MAKCPDCGSVEIQITFLNGSSMVYRECKKSPTSNIAYLCTCSRCSRSGPVCASIIEAVSGWDFMETQNLKS